MSIIPAMDLIMDNTYNEPINGKQDERHHEKVGAGEKADKVISTLLTRIQQPWQCDKNEARTEGTLYKRQRKHPYNWKCFKFVLSGNNLYYYTDEKAKKPRGIISVSFLSPKLQTTEEQLLEIKNPEVSAYHFQVFSQNRLDVLCALTNAELDTWHSALDKVIKDNLGRDDIAAREKALTELMPLLTEKSSMDIDRIMVMLSELENTGFAGSRLRKEKTGNLHMLVEEEAGTNVWVKYYFVLQNQCLYYYKTSKAPPKGVITLKFTIIAAESEPELQHCLRLTTPLHSFVLRAKHEVALDEWLHALNNSKAGRKVNAKTEEKNEFTDIMKISDIDISAEGSAGFHKKVIPQLTFATLEGKNKTVKLAIGSSVVGRSDSSTVKVEDKKVSRSHCKIEVNEHHAFVLDLGSGHGTKVNRSTIAKQILKHGDVIKVGKTKLTFEIVKK